MTYTLFVRYQERGRWFTAERLEGESAEDALYEAIKVAESTAGESVEVYREDVVGQKVVVWRDGETVGG